MRIRWAILLVPIALFAADDAARWWSHVEYLASDALEGRNTGSEGHRKAAEYVASQFAQAGLKPAGENGSFIQPVSFLTKQLDESASSLALRTSAGTKKLKPGDDAIIRTSVDPASSLDAELVFAGYGLKIPERNYDDFAGLDTKGRVAVYLSGAPKSVPGPLAAHSQSTAERWKGMRAAGIIGTISLANPKHLEMTWERSSPNRLLATMQLADPRMNETQGDRISITWNPAHADELFAGTGHTFKEIVDDAEAGKPLPHFTINARIQAKTVVKRSQVVSQNIAGIYTGSSKPDEYVVVSAHIDHLGVGPAVNGDTIFNGAMDNAAGVATMLDLAQRLHEGKTKTKRSILFVAVTGEEKGLLGSKYFANNPTVPVKSMVADINVDMFLPLYPFKILTVYGLDESTLGEDAKAVGAALGVKVQSDPDPTRNVFIRSDQYSFILRGIPSVMVDIGNEKESKEEQIEKDWLATRYHGRTDDVKQPIDRAAAAKFNDLVMRLAVRVADENARPKWEKTSFFRRFSP
ncbi:MAG TPA: M28 family metallopeptidase [Bryobacteraceae bacterium]|nr:M28 family metallopeptidase [Bryobacteraceae bacterium]